MHLCLTFSFYSFGNMLLAMKEGLWKVLGWSWHRFSNGCFTRCFSMKVFYGWVNVKPCTWNTYHVFQRKCPFQCITCLMQFTRFSVRDTILCLLDIKHERKDTIKHIYVKKNIVYNSHLWHLFDLNVLILPCPTTHCMNRTWPLGWK